MTIPPFKLPLRLPPQSPPELPMQLPLQSPTQSATQLPPLLQPWAAWLGLFPDDLAATLGQLLLRLQPLVGPLRRHAAHVAVEPAGVGDIVRRGSYERLLIGEWALADSAPDEFLRRAANNELLFTGPEPANSETSLRSVVLFDAGPAQLGEPRLLHLALFILLARRAELAGAEFQWGILQEPGILHEARGADSVRRLLAARTRGVLGDAGLEEWQAVLGEAPLDCWLVGDPATPAPAQAQSRVLVRRAWCEPQLEVELVQRRRSVEVTLPVPASEDSVRLLRRPFVKAAAGANLLAAKSHSLKRAPLFGTSHQYLAVDMVDGSVTVYRLPGSPRQKPGRPRNHGRRDNAEAIVATGLFQKSLGTVAVSGGKLHFSGFPSPFFSKCTLALPPSDQFHAVPGALRRTSAFYWETKGAQGGTADKVLVLDKHGRLVCWTCRRANPNAAPEREFTTVAQDVIGAVQHADRLLFAVSTKGRTDVYSLRKDRATREHLYPIMHEGEQMCFGSPHDWRGGHGAWALRLDGGDWLVGDETGAERVTLAEKDIVLGCARNRQTKRPALAVLAASRTRILLQGANDKVTLLENAEPIAQASFDPAEGRLAWLGQQSSALTVRAIDEQEPLLRVAANGDGIKETGHAGGPPVQPDPLNWLEGTSKGAFA